MKSFRMNRNYNILFVPMAALAVSLSAAPRINYQPVTPGGDLYWNDNGVWTNDNEDVIPPTVEWGAVGHDIFITNNANVILGRDGEEAEVRFLKIGALGNAGSNPSGLYSSIFDPNGRLTIIGGSLTVTSNPFHVGDANPYDGAYWTDPIRGEFVLENGVLNAQTMWIGARRGDPVHGGPTDGYYEQSGGTSSFTGSILIGSASNADNKETVHGEALVTGGAMTVTGGIYVGALQLSGGTWTPEQLATRGSGSLRIGPAADITTGILELRMNSEIVFELGELPSFNPINATTLNFYQVSKLTVDGSRLEYTGEEKVLPLITFSTLSSAPQTENISIRNCDQRFLPSIEVGTQSIDLRLSLADDGTWFGFNIAHYNGMGAYVDTADWVGIIEVSADPWLRMLSSGVWGMIAVETIADDGAWFWIPRDTAAEGPVDSGENGWQHIAKMDKWAWILHEADGEGMWCWFPTIR